MGSQRAFRLFVLYLFYFAAFVAALRPAIPIFKRLDCNQKTAENLHEEIEMVRAIR